MMKNHKIHFLGRATILVMLAGAAWGAGPGRADGVVLPSRAPRQTADRQSERMAEARDAVFRNEWKPAAAAFDEYLRTFASGKFRDEASYWSAYCRSRSARLAGDPGEALRLRLEALGLLDGLAAAFGRSPWAKEGQALKVEIQGELTAAGSEEYVLHLRRIVEDGDPSRKDLRLLALKALAASQPAWSLARLKQAVSEEPDPSIRIQAVRLLGDFVTEESASFLEDVALRDDDALIKQTASYWAGRIRFRLVPSRIQFEVWACSLLDRVPETVLPENRAAVFDLPAVEPWPPARLKETIEKRLGSRLSAPEASASSRENNDWEIYESVALTRTPYHDTAVTLSFRKAPTRIEGSVRFTDLRTGFSYYEAAPRPELNTAAPFSVEAGRDALVVLRRGTKAVLIILRFETAAGRVSSPSSRK